MAAAKGKCAFNIVGWRARGSCDDSCVLEAPTRNRLSHLAMGQEWRGLLVEAFPAAQLCHWGLPHQGYNRNTEAQRAKRRSIVQTLATRVDLRHCRETLEHCADALDALICAFAAVAVINDDTLTYAQNAIDQEGLIAVERA